MPTREELLIASMRPRHLTVDHKSKTIRIVSVIEGFNEATAFNRGSPAIGIRLYQRRSQASMRPRHLTVDHYSSVSE